MSIKFCSTTRAPPPDTLTVPTRHRLGNHPKGASTHLAALGSDDAAICGRRRCRPPDRFWRLSLACSTTRLAFPFPHLRSICNPACSRPRSNQAASAAPDRTAKKQKPAEADWPLRVTPPASHLEVVYLSLDRRQRARLSASGHAKPDIHRVLAHLAHQLAAIADRPGALDHRPAQAGSAGDVYQRPLTSVMPFSHWLLPSSSGSFHAFHSVITAHIRLNV